MTSAIFVDFENLRKGIIEKAYKEDKELKFDYTNNPDKLIHLCIKCRFSNIDNIDLYRIFFYSARPLKGHPKETEVNNFLDELFRQNYTALRLGKLVKRGQFISQKQVDMLIGLDIAEISIKKYADEIVLIGYDSDIAPALKTARMNGIRTSVVVFEDVNNYVEDSLLKHCDKIIRVKLNELYKELEIT